VSSIENRNRILAAAAMALALGSPSAAHAWTYQTDDGRQVSQNQVEREGAACAVASNGLMSPVWTNCMRARGFIVHSCDTHQWFVGGCF
jgi:hypothetical protein